MPLRPRIAARQRFLPYGSVRWREGAFPTDYGFTGRRAHPGLGLMYYRARYYHPALGRFVSADTVMPEPGNPQALNRYAYVYNNPLRYTDPTGHWVETAVDIISLAMTINDIRREGFTFWNTVSLITDIASLVLPVVPAGVSHAIRAARWASKAINAIDTARDIANIVDTAIDAAKAANRVDNAADAARALSRADGAVDALRGAENAEIAGQISISPQARTTCRY